MSSIKQVFNRVREQVSKDNFVKKDIEHLLRLFELREEMADSFMMFSKYNISPGNSASIKIDFAHLITNFHRLDNMAEKVASDLLRKELLESREKIKKSISRGKK